MGKDIDNPTVANFKEPIASTSFMTAAGPMKVDMRVIAQRIGRELDKGDIISIRGFRNAKGELTPDYDSLQIERKATQSDE